MTVDQHEKYMYRCLELARKGAGYTAPNPMVGAVLVQDDRIIGEGWHQRYGEAHAEVNAINSAQLSLSDRATGLTAFVSLEPCAHHGKTPPCADLLIRTGIPKVVIGCRDPFEAVNGKGVEKLRAAGVEVLEGVLEQECRELNKRFFTFHEMKRPYVILKWAQTADGFLANSPFTEGGMTENTAMKRLRISNEYTDRLVHRWRSEEAAILVGTNTALQDDPALTNRLWPGLSPVRLVVDMDLRLPSSLQLFNGEQKTFVFNAVKEETKQNLVYYRLEKNKSLISQLLPALHQLNIQSVLVEGGSRLLQSFIDTGLWDEARVITNTAMKTGTGLAAPFLENGAMKETTKLAQDEIQTWQNAGRIKK